MKKSLVLSSVVAALLMFSGCGTSSEEDSNTTVETPTTEQTTTVSGVVADGYIKGATVFADLNKNGNLDSGEPNGITDDNGKYTLNYNGSLDGIPIVSQNGFDIERNETFESTLVSFIDGNNINITPLTTLTYYYMKNKNVDFNTAKQKVAEVLDINSDDIQKDPTQNNTLKTLALKVQLSIETAAKLTNKEPEKVFEEVAENIEEDTNLTQVFENTFDDSNIMASINTIINIPFYTS